MDIHRLPTWLRPWLWAALLLSTEGLPCILPAAAATLSIDAGTFGKAFIPINAFGINTPAWTGTAALSAVTPRLKAAGTYYFRYPGGYLNDIYHWNGTGAFDGQGHWVPDGTRYSPSWLGKAPDCGSTNDQTNGVSMATDGDPATRWISNPDTDSPNAQWIYVDLGYPQTIDRVTLQWGTPYATQFKVQVWSGPGYPLPYQAATDPWTDTSAGSLSGTGGTQAVAFAPVATRYCRILCQASSATPAQYSIAELRVYNGSAQLTKNVATITAGPGGGGSNGTPDQSWTTASSTDPASAMDRACELDFETFMAWLKAYAPQAKPYLCVNMGTGTPQEAAAWVHYANVVKGYGVKDWEVGSELYGAWEPGGPMDAKDYARRFIEFHDAMEAADPSIHVFGPVYGGGQQDSPSNDFDGKSFLQGFIDRLASDPGGDQAADAQGIDIHWYPFFGAGAGSDAQLLATPEQLASYLDGTLPGELAKLPGAATVPVMMSETNASLANPLAVHLSAGLWLADWLGTWISHLGERAQTTVFEAVEPGDVDVNLNGGSAGFLNGVNDGYLYQPRAQYWALQLMARDWALPGDSNPEQLVQASSDQPLLSAYADLRPDGILSLLVINKDPANAYNATLNLAGFSPNPTAQRWTFDASNYAWNTSLGQPYHADPDSGPVQATETGISSGYTHSFGPYSITVIQFTDATKPLPSPTDTPTAQPTPTLTATPGGDVLVDDFEDPSRDGIPPSRQNLLNGTWSVNVSAGTLSGVDYTVPGASGTLHAAAWSLTVPAGGWANLVTSLPAPFNAAAAGFVGLQFWAYGDGNAWRAEIQTQSVTDYDFYGLNFTPPAGVWTLEQIPFSAMSRQSWGTQSPAPPATPTATDIVGLQFSSQGTGLLRLGLDQVAFYLPKPPPTPTATASPTPGAGSSLDVLELRSVPNPVTGTAPPTLCFDLAGRAQALHVRVYSSAYVRVADFSAPGGGPGWLAVPLAAPLTRNGIYVVDAWAERDGRRGGDARTKLCVLR